MTEWNPVVWIGRLFASDNDYGEHWFDNWDLRDKKEKKAAKLGLESEDLMIVDPRRFADSQDGPCNTIQVRKKFWTDVLESLKLSYDLLFQKARQVNKEAKGDPDSYIPDLEERIDDLRRKALVKTKAES